MSREVPSMDAWLKEAKAHESAPKIGMYLVHNGTVRQSAKAKVRYGAENTQDVTGMHFSYDPEKVEAVIADTRKLEGTEEDTFGNAEKLVKAGGPFPRIYHACGDQDFVLESAHATRDFFTAIDGNPFEYVYEEDPGAHTWEFWDEHIQHFLKYLNLEKTEGVRN